MSLTPEQLKELELYKKSIEVIKENANNLNTPIGVIATNWESIKEEIETQKVDIKNLILPNTKGNFKYPLNLQDEVERNDNPYYIFNNVLERDYNQTIAPFLRDKYNKTLDTDTSVKLKYNSDYLYTNRDLLDNFLLNTDNKDYYLTLISEVNNASDLNTLKSKVKNLYIKTKEVAILLLNITFAVRYIRAYGGDSDLFIDELITDFNKELFNLNKSFSLSAYFFSLNTSNHLDKALSLVYLIDNDVQSIEKEVGDQKKVELLEEVEEEVKEEVEKVAKKTVSNIESIIKEVEALKEENTLKIYVDKIVDEKDNSFNRLINFESVEKATLIQEAKTNFDSIFSYLFSTDPRLLTIYNNNIYRSRLEIVNKDQEGSVPIPKVDAYPYSNTYHTNWVEPFDKITGVVLDKLKELKTLEEKANLTKKDINDLNKKIDEVLSILILEVEPSIYTFWLSLDLFENKLKEENRSDFLEKLGLKTDQNFFFPYVEDISKDEESKGYRFLSDIKKEIKLHGTAIVETLIDKLVNIKRQTISNKLEELNNLIDNSDNDLALSLPDVQAYIDKLKEEETTFCNQVINVIKTQAKEYFLDTSVNNSSLGNIYKVLSQDELFREKYNLLSNVPIKNYKPVNKALLPLDSQPNFFVPGESLSITNEDIFKLWCISTKRIKEAANKTRVQFLDEKFKQLVLSFNNNEIKEFNETKTFILDLIEQDLYVDIAAYRKGIEPFALEALAYPANSNYYIPRNNTFDYDKISGLKFNSLAIIDLLIKIHKAITPLELSSIEERKKLKELQEDAALTGITNKLEKVNEENDKKREQIKEVKENWGIRISPASASKRVSIENIQQTKEPNESLTKEEEVNQQQEYNTVSNQFYKSWYMTLLPTMTSNLPVTGGSQAPGAQPGLNFRVVNSLIKHKIPGFRPIYQPMGIDTINCTIVGCFTGADGFDKNRIGSIESFTQAAHEISPDLLGLDGNVGFGTRDFINNAVTLYDSFENYQSFYNTIIEPNKEIEIEVNLRKNTSVLKNGSEGIFRDKITGNPKFRGYIKRFDSYYVRADRMWYIMDVQLTTNNPTKNKCINLTNIIAEAKPSDEQLNNRQQSIDELIACIFGGNLPSLYSRKGVNNENYSYTVVRNPSNGIVLPDKNNGDIRLAISKDGYGFTFEQDPNDPNKQRLIKGPIYPRQMFDELQRDSWRVSIFDRYYILLKCIAGYITESRGDQFRILVGNRIEFDSKFLGTPVELSTNQNRGFLNRVGRVLDTAGNVLGPGVVGAAGQKLTKIEVQYNIITGNLAEVDDSKVKNEYDIKILREVFFSQYIPLTGGLAERLIDFQKSIKKYIQFKEIEKVEACLNNERDADNTPSEGSTFRPTDPIEVTPDLKKTLLANLKAYLIENKKKIPTKLGRGSIENNEVFLETPIKDLGEKEENKITFFRFNVLKDQEVELLIEIGVTVVGKGTLKYFNRFNEKIRVPNSIVYIKTEGPNNNYKIINVSPFPPELRETSSEELLEIRKAINNIS